MARPTETPFPSTGARLRDNASGAIWTQDPNTGAWVIDPAQQPRDMAAGIYAGLTPSDSFLVGGGAAVMNAAQRLGIAKIMSGERGASAADWEKLSSEAARQNPISSALGHGLPQIAAGLLTGGALVPLMVGQGLTAGATARQGEGLQDALAAAVSSGVAQMPFRVLQNITGRGQGLRQAMKESFTQDLLRERALPALAPRGGVAGAGLGDEVPGIQGMPGGAVAGGKQPIAGYTEYAQQQLGEAKRLGMVVPDSLATGDAELAQEFARARNIPGTARQIQRDVDLPNKKIVNALAAKAIGVEGGRDLSPPVLQAAKQNFEEGYEAAVKQIGVTDGNELLARWTEAANNPEFYGSSGAQAVFGSRIRGLTKALATSDGQMAPEALKGLRSSLSKGMASANPEQADAFRALLDETTEYMFGKLGTKGAGKFAQLNEQYRAYKTLRQAIDRQGNVHAVKAAGLFERGDPGFQLGGREGLPVDKANLFTALRAQSIMQPALPQTGVQATSGIAAAGEAFGQFVPALGGRLEKIAKGIDTLAQRRKFTKMSKP